MAIIFLSPLFTSQPTARWQLPLSACDQHPSSSCQGLLSAEPDGVLPPSPSWPSLLRLALGSLLLNLSTFLLLHTLQLSSHLSALGLVSTQARFRPPALSMLVDSLLALPPCIFDADTLPRRCPQLTTHTDELQTVIFTFLSSELQTHLQARMSINPLNGARSKPKSSLS